MTDKDHKYNLEIRIENMSIEDLNRLKSVLSTIDKVQYKEFSKLPKTITERTSI